MLAAALCATLAVASPVAADPAADLLSDINAARAKQGLAPVRPAAVLSKVARAHSASMAERGFFDHRGLDGKRIADRLTDAGYGFLYAGENLSAGIENPDTVVRQWLLSPSHRDNLLEPRAREAGIGYVVAPRGPYRYYWTLILAEPAKR